MQNVAHRLSILSITNFLWTYNLSPKMRSVALNSRTDRSFFQLQSTCSGRFALQSAATKRKEQFHVPEKQQKHLRSLVRTMKRINHCLRTIIVVHHTAYFAVTLECVRCVVSRKVKKFVSRSWPWRLQHLCSASVPVSVDSFRNCCLCSCSCEWQSSTDSSYQLLTVLALSK